MGMCRNPHKFRKGGGHIPVDTFLLYIQLSLVSQNRYLRTGRKILSVLFA